MIIGGALWPFALSSLLFVLSVCGIGVLVSILLSNQSKATEVLMVVAMSNFILSGFTWPLSQMPGWVQLIADLISLAHCPKSFRLLSLNQSGISSIYSSLLAMGIIAFVSLSLSMVFLRYKIKKVKKLRSQRRISRFLDVAKEVLY